MPMHPISAHPSSRQRGFVAVYSVILLTVLLAFASLAVDYGRVQVVKAQLQRTADAAARAAASSLSSGVSAAQTAAVSVAAQNTADGSAVTLNPTLDVEFGTWNATTKSFTVLTGSQQSGAKAVRVTAVRSAARGNAVPLQFARAIGKNTCDVSARAIVNITTTSQGYGVVGLSWVNMTGNSLIDSYNSQSGPYTSTSARNNGSVVSNGDITLAGNASIKGNASPGPGRSVIRTGSTSVYGNTNPLATSLQYPAPSAGSYATTNDNSRISGNYIQTDGSFYVPGNQTVNVPAGNYYVKNFYMSANSDLNIKGDVTIYIAGNFFLGSNTSVTQNKAINLKIRMITPGTTATLSGTSDIYADFYAPVSDVTITSNSDLYGSVIGRTLTLAGNGGLHYDESLPSPNASVSGGISLVR